MADRGVTRRRFLKDGTTLGVAGVWLVGGLASGPLHLGWIQTQNQTVRRPVIAPVATGAAASQLCPPCPPPRSGGNQ